MNDTYKNLISSVENEISAINTKHSLVEKVLEKSLSARISQLESNIE